MVGYCNELYFFGVYCAQILIEFVAREEFISL